MCSIMMTKLSILKVLPPFLLLFLCSFTPIAFTHQNAEEIGNRKIYAPGVPPAKVSYVENPHNQPGITDNYTFSILSADNKTKDSEREHLQEHLGVELDPDSVTTKELQFYYFKMFDTDNNQMLDGTEMIKSKIHIHNNEEGGNDEESATKIFTDQELEQELDPILFANDANKDGYIDYYEFKLAQEYNERQRKESGLKV